MGRNTLGSLGSGSLSLSLLRSPPGRFLGAAFCSTDVSPLASLSFLFLPIHLFDYVSLILLYTSAPEKGDETNYNNAAVAILG